MCQSLDILASIAAGCDAWSFPWPELRYAHTQALRAKVAERYSPATANKILSALRGVLRECFRLGLMGAEDYHRAADLEAVRGSRVPKGRALTAAEIAALFAACDTDPAVVAGRRDAAILGVLFGCGLRRTELVELDLAHLVEDNQALRVKGKGNKERLVYLPAGAVARLEAWLLERGREEGPLFLPVGDAIARQPNRIHWRRLSDPAVRVILQRRARQAGVTAFAPHDARRTLISGMLEAGVDLATVQDVAGHANIQTTKSYDRRGDRRKAEAASKIQIPMKESTNDSSP